MDTAEYLLARQEIQNRLASHRYKHVEKPGLGLLGWLSLATGPAAGWFWFKKRQVRRFEWAGGLLSAVVWIGRILLQGAGWPGWIGKVNGRQALESLTRL